MKTRRITLETHLHKIAEYDETVKNLESVFNIQKQKVIRYIGSVVTSFPKRRLRKCRALIRF